MRLKFDFRRFWIAEAVTALGALGSAAINSAAQARTNASNRAQANYAFQQEQAAIRAQNEYNSPAQQVLRLKAAGLNPALAYGASGEVTGQQAAVPSFNAIPGEAPNIGNIGSSMADAIRTGIEVKDLERRNALATAEIAVQSAQAYLSTSQAQLNDASRQEILSLLGYKIENLESQTQMNWDNVLKARAEVSKIHDERKEILSRIGLNDAQIKNLAASANLSETQAFAILERLPHEVQQMDAQAAFAWVQSDVGRAEVAKINREISHIGFVEWANSRDFDFTKASKVADLKFQQYGFKVDIAKQLMQSITLITGAAAVRNGGAVLSPQQRQPSPIVTPSGGSMFGQNWAQ